MIKVIVNNASYTINIYNTSSRRLVNGNGASHFIAKDIPSIHKIVLKGLHEQGVKGLSIEELNKQLSMISRITTNIPHSTHFVAFEACFFTTF
jgi:hypothetical protein